MKCRKSKLMITWQFPLKGFEFSWTKVQSEIKWVIQEVKLCLNTNSGRKRNLSKYWTKNLRHKPMKGTNQRRNSAWINKPMCTGILWICGVWSLTQQTFLCVVARVRGDGERKKAVCLEFSFGHFWLSHERACLNWDALWRYAWI